MKAYRYVSQFACIGDACEDTCCKEWGMQVDQSRLRLYAQEQPHLLESVAQTEVGPIMRRDRATDHCVQLSCGLCRIHGDYGTNYLGDACHFYPRTIRAYGDERLMSASLSCPEIARFCLLPADSPFALEEVESNRLPEKQTDYAPAGLTPDQTIAITTSLIAYAEDDSRTPERAVAAIAGLLYALDGKSAEYLPMAVATYSKIAEGLLPQPEHRTEDPYFLLQTLRGLIHAAPKSGRIRLEACFAMMEQACAASIHRESLDIFLSQGKEHQANDVLQGPWAQGLSFYLRRYLQTQIAMMGLPFGGFGNSMRERVMVLCVRFATVRLALLSDAYLRQAMPEEADIVRIVQSISRFMDHLSDPALSVSLYTQAGWNREARLRALVGDA